MTEKQQLIERARLALKNLDTARLRYRFDTSKEGDRLLRETIDEGIQASVALNEFKLQSCEEAQQLVGELLLSNPAELQTELETTSDGKANLTIIMHGVPLQDARKLQELLG